MVFKYPEFNVNTNEYPMIDANINELADGGLLCRSRKRMNGSSDDNEIHNDEIMNDKLASGVDNIKLSPDQVREIIQGLRLPGKFPPTDEPESSATKELTVLKHYCRLGDYAGRVFNDLKQHNTDAPISKLATELVEVLGAEDENGPMALAIEHIAHRIRSQGAEIDSAIAKFAIKAYAARNQACHGEAGHLVMAEKWDDLAQRISLDLEALFEILPEGQVQQLETWHRCKTEGVEVPQWRCQGDHKSKERQRWSHWFTWRRGTWPFILSERRLSSGGLRRPHS